MKRLKRVVTEDQVAHLWANQLQSDARNARGTFYFNGATIYSYGSHFPIATMLEDGTVLFTTRGYSNTTTKHLWTVRRAISHKRVIEMMDVPTVYDGKATKKNCNQIGCNERNIKNWLFNIEQKLTELANPKNRDISGRVTYINRELDQLNSYLNYFGENNILKTLPIDLKKIMKKTVKLVAASQDGWNKRIKEAEAKALNRTGITEEQREANRIKREAKEQADWQTYFALWQAGKDQEIADLPDSVKKNAAKAISGNNYYSRRNSVSSLRWGFSDSNGHTRLRFNAEKQRVETSKGIEVPVKIAERTYNKIKDCTDCKELDIDVVGYTLTDANTQVIKAGCHTIPRSDVEYIAQLLGWK